MAFIVSHVEGAQEQEWYSHYWPYLQESHSYGEHFLRNSKSFMRQEMNTALQKVQRLLQKYHLHLFFKGTDGKKYVSFFSCIIIFYVCWNLLANTFGQFQTYILVKANASQSLATGCGIVLNIVGLICGILFASAAGSKHRNKFFYVGIVIQAGAMIGITWRRNDRYDRRYDCMLQHR